MDYNHERQVAEHKNWLALPETQKLIKNLEEACRVGDARNVKTADAQVHFLANAYAISGLQRAIQLVKTPLFERT